MYKNYFYLCRCVNQLEEIAAGHQILDVYTQEKDKLFLHIPLPDKPNFHIIISTNLQNPFITTREEHFKAKKNTSNFFSDYLPVTMRSVNIASGDRIINLLSDNSSLAIIFKGGQSNVILTDPNRELHPFKKESADELEIIRKELINHNFIKSPETVLSLIRNSSDEASIKKMPFIGKEIIKEAELRGEDFRNNLIDVINEIANQKILLYFDDYLGKPVFHPASFRSRRIPEEHFEFDDYFKALNKYFTLSYSQSKAKNIRREIEKFLAKEIEPLSNKLNKLKGRIEAGSKEEIYTTFGTLLLANIHILRRGMKEVELVEYSTGTTYKIKLDEKLSPHQNIDRYFEKSRSEKIEYQKSKELLSLNALEYERLIKIKDKFEHCEDHESLQQIKTELKMKSGKSESDETKEKSLYRHFLIASKYHVYVGKDSKNNDRLTTKFAKQNDFWFHARSVSGSHVVLRVENSKEAIPKNILQKTASLAAFYSKAKTSKVVPVTYTLKKYVNKNARHEPGQVTVTKESVLLVKPEIPADCESVLE